MKELLLIEGKIWGINGERSMGTYTEVVTKFVCPCSIFMDS